MNVAVKQKLSRAEELNSIGAKFFREGHMEPARLHFLAALSMEPNQPQVLQNLGAVLRNLNHYEVAESVARRSVFHSNNNPYCRSNLGVAQLGLKKYAEAIGTLRSVARDLPSSGPSWHNLGLALYITGRHGEALDMLDKSLTCDPNNIQVQSDRALTLLAMGKIQEGLAAYEVRWKLLFQNKIWQMGIPEWQGEPISGRRLLVHHEQGFGDSLMLVRFVHQLLKWHADVTLAVPGELCRLFARSFTGVKVAATDDVTVDDGYDYHTPLLSVVRWLGIEKPSTIDARPYLLAHPMSDYILPDSSCKIGICWASGNHGAALNDRRRVVPLTAFLPLTEIPGVNLISLQKGDAGNDIVRNGMEGIVFDLMSKAEDFADTADIIAHLDVVISVDSAVAHLAGAIGKPCMMLSPYTRCWRWWNGTSGYPWYERMTVFYQSPNGIWREAMLGVTKAIKAKLEQQNRDM